MSGQAASFTPKTSSSRNSIKRKGRLCTEIRNVDRQRSNVKGQRLNGNGGGSSRQTQACDQDRGNFTELATPSERISLQVTGWKSTLFETIQHETVLEAQVQVVLERAVKIKLRPGLVPHGSTVGLTRGEILRDLDGIDCPDIALYIHFLSHMHGGSIVKSRVCNGENESPTRLE